MLNSKKFGDTGQPVVILHGVFGSSENWFTVGKALSAHFQIHLLDLPNHGLSAWSDRFNYTVMANAVVDYINENNLEPVNLIGHSMGGKVAMVVAKNSPERLLKLVVVDYAPKFYPANQRMIVQGLNSIDMQTLQSRNQANEIMKSFEGTESVRQFVLKNLYRNEHTGHFEWRINLPLITRELENIGEEIVFESPFTKPTLFIKGELSTYIKPEDEASIMKTFPQTQFEIISGAGHIVHIDKPDAFVEVLKTFLE